MLASQIVSRIYPKIGPSRLMAAGAVGVAVAVGLLSLLTPETSVWVARALMFATGYSMAHIFMPTQTAAFATVSPAATGRASTLFNAQSRLGPALGVALLSTVLAAIGTVTTGPSGTPSANLAAYHTAFRVAAGLALVAAVLSLFVSDRDAAPTMVRKPRAKGPAMVPAQSRDS
jgi:MFS family permease